MDVRILEECGKEQMYILPQVLAAIGNNLFEHLECNEAPGLDRC